MDLARSLSLYIYVFFVISVARTHSNVDEASRAFSKALPTCALLNFTIYSAVSWESAGFVQEFATELQKTVRKQSTMA